MLKITSDCSATARGEAAQRAPFAKSFSAFVLVRLYTVAEKPARKRFSHMLEPITPVPIQPRRCVAGETKGSLAEDSVMGSCWGTMGI